MDKETEHALIERADEFEEIAVKIAFHHVQLVGLVENFRDLGVSAKDTDMARDAVAELDCLDCDHLDAIIERCKEYVEHAAKLKYEGKNQ